MPVYLFANNAHTTLAGPIAPGATSLSLAAGTGTLFPNPAVGQLFELTLTSQSSATTFEIVYCTARVGDVCTILRAQEGTTPLAFVAGDFADNFLTAGTTAQFIQATQLQQQAGNYAVDTGTVNNVVAALNPPPASLSLIIGTPVRVLIANTNTGPSALALTPLASTAIRNADGTVLAVGQLQAGGVVEFIYNGTTFNLTSQAKAFADPGGNSGGHAGVVIDGTVTSATNGANLLLKGNGGTTPSFWVRAFSGLFQVLNSSYTSIFQIAATGNVSISGGVTTQADITTQGGRLRASLGTSGGDANTAPILSDFPFSAVGAGGRVMLPNGFSMQSGNISAGASLITNLIFPTAFPSACLGVWVGEENAVGSWGAGAPTLYAASNIARNGCQVYAVKWTGSTWAPSGGTSCQWQAWGF